MDKRTVDWESEFQKNIGGSDTKLGEAAQYTEMSYETQLIRAHKLKTSVLFLDRFLFVLNRDGSPEEVKRYEPTVNQRLSRLKPLVEEVTKTVAQLRPKREAIA